MEEANANSDRYFDLSLRLLTIFVLVSLVCCIGFLAYRWIGPRWHRGEAPAVQAHAPAVAAPAPAAAATPPPADQVLMDPGKTFKCEEQGKAVSFSDRPRPCDSGSMKILPLNTPQPATGGR